MYIGDWKNGIQHGKCIKYVKKRKEWAIQLYEKGKVIGIQKTGRGCPPHITKREKPEYFLSKSYFQDDFYEIRKFLRKRNEYTAISVGQIQHSMSIETVKFSDDKYFFGVVKTNFSNTHSGG